MNDKKLFTAPKNVPGIASNSFDKPMQSGSPQPKQNSNKIRWTEDNKSQLIKSISGPGFRGVKSAK
ncbi:MAG: hypothetical protein HAW61_00365 [Candidatus Portiera sp.]|nr:hypothetical protein [Portiera sp.]